MVALTRSMEFVDHRHRGRGAAARDQPDQALRPRFNVAAARRQELPRHRHPPRPPVAAAAQAPRRAREPGDYFGPFASAGAVNRTLNTLQKAFLLRSCSRQRLRDPHPALHAAPDQALLGALRRPDRPRDYAPSSTRARLPGRPSREVQAALSQRDARPRPSARVRARRRAARPHPRAGHIQSPRAINPDDGGRGRRLRRSTPRAARPACRCSSSAPARTGATAPTSRASTRIRRRPRSLAAFLGQFYDDRPPPKLILVSLEPCRARAAGGGAPPSRPAARWRSPCRSAARSAQLVEHALDQRPRGAGAADGRERQRRRKLLTGVARRFGLEAPPERIEVYDNSHIMGTNAVGAMIVAGPEGFQQEPVPQVQHQGPSSRPATTSA